MNKGVLGISLTLLAAEFECPEVPVFPAMGSCLSAFCVFNRGLQAVLRVNVPLARCHVKRAEFGFWTLYTSIKYIWCEIFGGRGKEMEPGALQVDVAEILTLNKISFGN